MAWAGKYGRIYLSGIVPTAFTKSAAASNVDHTVYTITDKAYLDPNTPVLVYADDALVSPTEYTVAYAGGKIIFQVARGAAVVITVTGATVTVAAFADCHEWSLDVQTDMVEVPVFQSEWKSYVEGQTGATGSFSHWFTVAGAGWFLTRLTAGLPLLLLLYIQENGATKERFEVMVRLSGDGIKLMTDGAVDEAISFTVTGPVNYATT